MRVRSRLAIRWVMSCFYFISSRTISVRDKFQVSSMLVLLLLLLIVIDGGPIQSSLGPLNQRNGERRTETIGPNPLGLAISYTTCQLCYQSRNIRPRIESFILEIHASSLAISEPPLPLPTALLVSSQSQNQSPSNSLLCYTHSSLTLPYCSGPHPLLPFSQ